MQFVDFFDFFSSRLISTMVLSSLDHGEEEEKKLDDRRTNGLKADLYGRMMEAEFALCVVYPPHYIRAVQPYQRAPALGPSLGRDNPTAGSPFRASSAPHIHIGPATGQGNRPNVSIYSLEYLLSVVAEQQQ
jgi:hypothetical protein